MGRKLLGVYPEGGKCGTLRFLSRCEEDMSLDRNEFFRQAVRRICGEPGYSKGHGELFPLYTSLPAHERDDPLFLRSRPECCPRHRLGYIRGGAHGVEIDHVFRYSWTQLRRATRLNSLDTAD